MNQSCSRRERGCLPLLVVSFLLTFLILSEAAVFSVDFGSESLKVAVVNPRPGQSPISIAINEYSKRKSPSLVAFSNGDRLVAEEAAGIVARYPERVYSRVRDILGKPEVEVKKLLAEAYLPFEVVPDSERNVVKVKAHGNDTEYALEELIAMILSYARDLAETHSKTVIRDAVLTVPPFFGQSQRLALLDASKIAGVNVMALVQEHSGAALQYGIDKDFSNSSRTVVMYDMGASSTYASVIEYSSYITKERGKNTSVNQFQVKGVRWDASLGGLTLESRLLEYFAKEFNEKVGGGVDVRSSPKAMAKLKKEVKRTKEVLSANTEAPLNVESLLNDRDFRTSITRTKFEELCEDLWQRALVPLVSVLADLGLSTADLDAVELLGGGTRVPRVQAELSKFLADKGPDRHLDADEAMALGSSLLAANISDGFKLNRKIGMIDGLPYSILFQLSGLTSEPKEAQSLFPPLKKLPSKVIRSMKDQVEDFEVSLLYDADALPPGKSDPLIAKLQVLGVANTTAKYSTYNLTQPLKTSLHFSLSRSGVVGLDKADLVAEFSEWIDVPEPVVNATSADNATLASPSNATSSNSSAPSPDSSPEGESGEATSGEDDTREGAVDSAPASNHSSNSNETAPAVVMRRRLRKRTIRIPLKVQDVTEGIPKAMSSADVTAGIARLAALKQRDAEKRAMAEAKNSLEAHIYATKDKLESEGTQLKQVATSKQLAGLSAELSEAEEWLWMEGDEATTAAFQDKLAALKFTGDKLFFRLSELEARPAAVKHARKVANEMKDLVDSWDTSKPWINATDKDKILDGLANLLSWIDAQEYLQEKAKSHDDPVFTSAEVYSKLEALSEKVVKLSRTPKPKPKAAPKPAAPANSTDGSPAANSTDSIPSEGAEQTNSTADGGDPSGGAGHDEL